jgi:uncharacterized protein DUF2442
MFTIVKVVQATAVSGYRMRVAFSDGSIGEHDFGPLIEEGGPMIEPLRDPAFFGRVFVEMGVPTWPNGFDVDAIKLHMDMEAAGELNRDAAE